MLTFENSARWFRRSEMLQHEYIPVWIFVCKNRCRYSRKRATFCQESRISQHCATCIHGAGLPGLSPKTKLTGGPRAGSVPFPQSPAVLLRTCSSAFSRTTMNSSLRCLRTRTTSATRLANFQISSNFADKIFARICKFAWTLQTPNCRLQNCQILANLPEFDRTIQEFTGSHGLARTATGSERAVPAGGMQPAVIRALCLFLRFQQFCVPQFLSSGRTSNSVLANNPYLHVIQRLNFSHWKCSPTLFVLKLHYVEVVLVPSVAKRLSHLPLHSGRKTNFIGTNRTQRHRNLAWGS